MWEMKDSNNIFLTTAQLSIGMIDLVGKLQSAAGRSFEPARLLVREHLRLSKA